MGIRNLRLRTELPGRPTPTRDCTLIAWVHGTARDRQRFRKNDFVIDLVPGSCT